MKQFLIILLAWSLLLVTGSAQANTLDANKDKNSLLQNTALYNAQVTAPERQLLAEFLRYVHLSILARREFSSASKQITSVLENAEYWQMITIEDAAYSKLLKELNDSINYYVQKSVPLAGRIEQTLAEMESKFLTSYQEIENNGLAPDDLMNNARDLVTLYEYYESFWTSRKALLLKIVNLEDTLYLNYMIRSDECTKTARKQAALSIKELKDKLSIALSAEDAVTALQTQHEYSQQAYNTTVEKQLLLELERTDNLIAEIKHQIKFLNSSRETNQQHHAELLKETVGVLQKRKGHVRDKLFALDPGKYDGKNLIYLPEHIGRSAHSQAAAKQYRLIVSDLITATNKRLKELQPLPEKISAMKATLDREKKLFTKLLTTESSVTEDEKKRVQQTVDSSISSITERLVQLEQTVSQALELSNEVDFSSPGEIIADIHDSSSIIRLNILLNDINEAISLLEFFPVSLDMEMALFISILPDKEQIKNKTLLSLQKESKKFVKLSSNITQVGNKLTHLFEQDREQIGKLQEVSRQLIVNGEEVFDRTIAALSKKLDRPDPAAQSPYYQYAFMAKELIAYRGSVIHDLGSLFPQLKTDSLEDDCPSCNKSNSGLWNNAPGFGNPIAAVMEQLDGLESIESLYTSAKFDSANVFEDTKNLFALANRLNNLPAFHLNDDSIDLLFTIGKGVVAVKGIGAPERVVLGLKHPVTSVFKASYIGFQFNPKAAWNSTQRKIAQSDLILNSADSLIEIAQKTVNTSRVVKGELTTQAVTVADAVTKNITKALDSTGDYLAWEMELGKDVLDNTLNQFVNDKGTVDWLEVAFYGTGFVAGTAGCTLAIVGSAGAAAAPCIAAAITIYSPLIKGGIDTGAMEKRGWWSEESAEWAKLGVDVADFTVGFIAGGVKNISEVKKLSKFGTLDKILDTMDVIILFSDVKDATGLILDLIEISGHSIEEYAAVVLQGTTISIQLHLTVNIGKLYLTEPLYTVQFQEPPKIQKQPELHEVPEVNPKPSIQEPTLFSVPEIQRLPW